MRFKCPISHVPNLIQELNAYEGRLLPHLRLGKSNIRQKFDSCFTSRTSHVPNLKILSINYVINVFLNITALVIGLKPISMTTHALTVTTHASKVLSFDSYFGVFLFFCSQQPRNFSGRFCFGHADSHCIYLVNKEVSKRETSL